MVLDSYQELESPDRRIERGVPVSRILMIDCKTEVNMMKDREDREMYLPMPELTVANGEGEAPW